MLTISKLLGQGYKCQLSIFSFLPIQQAFSKQRDNIDLEYELVTKRVLVMRPLLHA